MNEVMDRPRNVADAHTAKPSLQGRKALITGGTTGIGRAIATLLASEGADVFVCGRNKQHLEDALKRIREVGSGDGMNLDLADRESVKKLFDAAENALGKLDIVVINAAEPLDDTEGTSEKDLHYKSSVDYTAYLATAKAAIERMGRGADIIFIGSMSAVSREPGSSLYIAAKAGIEAYAQALRKEVAEKDIKVGLIEPGFTGADFQYPDFPAAKQRELINKDQMLRAEDIAVAAHFMLSQPRRTAVSMMRIETRLDHP